MKKRIAAFTKSISNHQDGSYSIIIGLSIILFYFGFIIIDYILQFGSTHMVVKIHNIILILTFFTLFISPFIISMGLLTGLISQQKDIVDKNLGKFGIIINLVSILPIIYLSFYFRNIIHFNINK